MWFEKLSVIAFAALKGFRGEPILTPSLASRYHQVDLAPVLNSRCTSLTGDCVGQGFVDGSTFPIAHLPTGDWIDKGVPFALPTDWTNLSVDNVECDSQYLWFDQPLDVAEVHFAGAGDHRSSVFAGRLELLHGDGSSSLIQMEVNSWWRGDQVIKSPITSPFHYQPSEDGSTKNYNTTSLHHHILTSPPRLRPSQVVGLKLPAASPTNTLHIFAISLQLSAASSDKVNQVVEYVRGTRLWENVGSTRGQVYEVTIRNPHKVAAYRDEELWTSGGQELSLREHDIQTILPAQTLRLAPGESRVYRVIISPVSRKATLSSVDVFLGDTKLATIKVEGSRLVHDWSEWHDSQTSLDQHSSPKWYNDAKFGIFVHWGLYAVPAFDSEWYNYRLHQEIGGSVYHHHLETFGPHFHYDDFIPKFTADKFNASTWVDFFADVGARYFVFTTKHHDGYAMFDTKSTSKRNSLLLGPKRDFLGELMTSAKERHPELHRGTYFSMPEWFNPLYAKYGYTTFPGIARNPYNNSEIESYAGFVDHVDFVEDVQLEQMRILANDYETEIMWCDIGLANHTSKFAAEWYSRAAKAGRQVTMDSRCGIAGDFDTPEQTKYSSLPSSKWESCITMDPSSWGHNKFTPPENYLTAHDVVHTLVDIVAKGGNLLLNVGPDLHGEILPVMKDPLIKVGEWLRKYGEAIYASDTVPYLFELTNAEVDLRFTRTTEAFYIIGLNPLARTILRVRAPIPILPGDTVNMLGWDKPLKWGWHGDELQFEIPMAIHLDRYAWVIRITPGGKT